MKLGWDRGMGPLNLKPMYRCSPKNESESVGSVNIFKDGGYSNITNFFNRLGWTFNVQIFAKKNKKNNTNYVFKN